MIGFACAPVSWNATVGATIQFSCQHRNGVVVWRINGERVNNLLMDTSMSTLSLLGVMWREQGMEHLVSHSEVSQISMYLSTTP